MKSNILTNIIVSLYVLLFLFIIYEAFTSPVQAPTLYECPCESKELIKDVVRHTNKAGMKSVTTFVDVKGCLIVNKTK